MKHWPVLRSYEGAHLRRVAMPLGGIGTGTVSLGGRGDLRDWELMNRPAKGFTPGNAFFAISVDGERYCLEGPIDPADFDGGFGATTPNHGLPRFRKCRFDAAYPLATVHLKDDDVKVEVTIEAFNPLIPTDADASGIPTAVLRYRVRNSTKHDVEVTVCGSVPNFIGRDDAKDNENRPIEGGVLLESKGLAADHPQWGTIALVANGEGEITTRTAWAELSWGDSLLDFWDDLADGALKDHPKGGAKHPIASVALTKEIPADSTETFEFLLAWHFPNRQDWDNKALVGNYYTTQYTDAEDVVRKTIPRLADLEAKTVEFVRALVESDLPEPIKEAALFNVVTLRSQTAFRTPDGHFFGWEGCSDNGGCCEGSCTHVWNYEHTTAHLFGSLARSMREIEFGYATNDDGLMSFRVRLPLEARAQEWDLAAADGQMGCLMKLHREWRLSGDDAMLRRLWPMAKRALEFAWIPNGWDGDRDGLMEGCQHNTMDVEYYGPNPEMGSWYLGALRAAEEMARHVSDEGFADECRRVFESGRAAMDRELFNGHYYEHRIIPPKEAPPKGLRHESMGAQDLAKPELQLGAGCLTDQLVGQTMAHTTGLGYLLDEDHVTKTLKSLMRMNYRRRLWGHFNHLRTYALQDEPGMLIAAYPEDKRPERPFPYCNEVWPGLEYTAAAHMIFEGMRKEGLEVVESVRTRFDGQRRNPFDEMECGHHYARSMAAWGCLLAWTGFSYDAQTMKMSFRGKPDGHWFWSTGNAYGTVTSKHGKPELTLLGGHLDVEEVTFA